ncbi:MAG TPA: rod-binding protein [Nitrospiraceae bacterium]|nr:rod-binding protein [Nitrospiraceae bacterium]
MNPLDPGLSLNTIAPIDLTRQAEDAGRALASSGGLGQVADIRSAAQAFEGYFISYLLKVMRETIPTGLIDNKAGQQFYSFYDQEIGRLAAQAGGIGLGRMVEEQIHQINSDTVIHASQVPDKRDR